MCLKRSNYIGGFVVLWRNVVIVVMFRLGCVNWGGWELTELVSPVGAS